MQKTIQIALGCLWLYWGITDIQAQCTAKFETDYDSTTPACGTAEVQFTNESTPTTNTIYQWDFGDGKTSEEKNPTHIFTATGNASGRFTVTLQVTDTVTNCTSNTQKEVRLRASPEIVLENKFQESITEFSNCVDASPSNPGFSIELIDKSVVKGGITRYLIDWGDGDLYDDSVAPSGHNYQGLGIYTIKYTIFGSNGCVQTKEFKVFNISSPGLGVTKGGNTSGCGPIDATFFINETENHDPSMIYNIDFGDGESITYTYDELPDSIVHRYTQTSCGLPNNQFIFRVIVYTGATSADCEGIPATVGGIKVYTMPQAGVEASQNQLLKCVGQSFTFSNLSTQGYNSSCSQGTTYLWDFGDGTPMDTVYTKKSQTHKYTAPGYYTVMLIAENRCGSTKDSLQVYVCEGKPQAAFTAKHTSIASAPSGTCGSGVVTLSLPSANQCAPLTLDLTDTSVLPSDCPPNFFWSVVSGSRAYSFSNGRRTSSAQNEKITFTQSGEYLLRFRVGNVCGDDESCIRVVVTDPPPKPTILGLQNKYCAGELIDLHTDTPAATYLWKIEGTGGTPNPILSIDLTAKDIEAFTGLAPGQYQVSLTAGNACGDDTEQKSFTVFPLPSASISPVQDTVICQDERIVLRTTAGSTLKYTWLLNGTAITGADTPDYEASVAGLYQVVVTDSVTTCADTSAAVRISINSFSATLQAQGKTQFCPEESILLNLQANTLPNASYRWLKDGQAIADTGNTETYQATDTGTYQAEIRLGNCTRVSNQISVIRLAPPSVEAGQDTTFCLIDQTVSLQNFTPTGGTWRGIDFIDAQAGTLNPLDVGAGIYTLSYSRTGNNTCTAQDSLVLNIVSVTTAEAGDSFSVCENEGLVALKGQPSGGVWLGGGVTGLSFDPSITGAGAHVLYYQVGKGTCLSVDSLTVEVRPAPVQPVIQELTDNYCAGQPVDFSTRTPSPQGYTWKIKGEGSTPDPAVSIDLTLADPLPVDDLPEGTYQLWLTTGNSCGQDSAARTFVVHPLPVASLLPAQDTVLCVGDAVVFRVPSNGNFHYEWQKDGVIIPGASEATYTTTQEGNYQLILTNRHTQCTDTSNVVRVSLNQFDAVIQAMNPTTLCPKETILVNLKANTVPGAVYQWFDGQQIIPNAMGMTYQATQEGDYRVKVTADRCDKFSNTVSVTRFATSPVEAGKDTVVCLIDQTVVLQGFTPVGGTWQGIPFIDDTRGTFNPQQVGGGTYTLYYSRDDANACNLQDSLQLTIVPLTPARAGSYPPVCINEGKVSLAGQPAGGHWSGAGVAVGSTFFDPVTAGAGAHTLYYTIGKGTCTSTDTVKIIVKLLPLVDAGSAQAVCLNTPAFQLTPLQGKGAWTGAGVEATGWFDPAVAGTGVHLLVFSVTDALTQCRHQDTLSMTVYAVPSPRFAFKEYQCVGETRFQNTTPSVAGYSLSYVWDYGDGSPVVQGAEGRHVYAQPGTYPVTLSTFTSPGNCVERFTDTVKILGPPTAGIRMESQTLCGDGTVSFASTSTGRNLSYRWDFGNGETSISENPQNIPFMASLRQDTTYVITLTVSQEGMEAGCRSHTTTDTLVVKPLPQARFHFTGKYLPVCSAFPLEIDNFSFGQVARYVWDFGDGSPLYETTEAGILSHTFYYTGTKDTTYQVTLRTYNECGADSLTLPVTVVPEEIEASLSIEEGFEGCMPFSMTVRSNQTGFNTTYWDFGDGGTLTGATEVTHTYTQPGTYRLRLLVSNGCDRDTVSQQITVFEAPNASFAMSARRLCMGEPLNLVNNSATFFSSVWDLGDGTQRIASHAANVYKNPGKYTITLTVTDSLTQCKGVFSQEVEVVPLPEVSFAPHQVSICAGETIVFQNTSLHTDQVFWSLGAGEGVSETWAPSYTYTNPGVYEVQLIAYNILGCTDTTVREIRVRPRPQAAFDIDFGENTCRTPLEVKFSVRHPEELNGRLFWNFGEELEIPGGTEVTHTFTNDSDSTQVNKVTLRVVNEENCEAVYEDFITVCPQDCEERLTFPNTFTPNRDYLNEVFRPLVRTGDNRWRPLLRQDAIPGYLLEIYSRKGELIFRSQDYLSGWDGRKQGSPMEEGVYVYKALYQCSSGKSITQKGEINLKY